jgi:hypothetical protein
MIRRCVNIFYVQEMKCEGPEKAIREWVNESQSKFLVVTWPISRNQPDVPSLLTRPRSPSYRQATGPRNWVKSRTETTN